MSTPEAYTLKDIAAILGVSRQALYKRLRADDQLRNEVDSTCVNQNGKKVYTVDTLEALKQALSVETCKPECKPDVNQLTAEVDRLTREVDRLTRQVDTLKKERDKAIDELKSVGIESLSFKRRVNQLTQVVDTERQNHAEARETVSTLQKIIDTMTAAHTAEVQRLTAELDQLRHDLNEERQHSRAQSDTLAQLADQAQRLQLAQMQPPALLDQKPPNLWQRIFGKRTRHNDDTE